jgi:hydroxyacylglutathione hydrolase
MPWEAAMEPVKIERFYLSCLAHASYMIGSGGVAAVIDPQRDVDLYLKAATRNGWRIEYIIETHLHADFVSGHRELADRTGAQILLGPRSDARFPHIVVNDESRIRFGRCRFRFLHTPGHTLESICIVMNDCGEPHRPAVVFTGDTLFVGDVGRPDLSVTHRPEELAAMLYRSLHDKLLTLSDDTEIFPAHGAGSLCGRQMSSESSSTIGKQRHSNYALLAKNSDEFVRLLTDNMPARPEYFAQEVELNRRGAAPVSSLAQLVPLMASEVAQLQKDGAVVVDTRPAMQFAVAHVPGSLHMALTGQYASWAARVLGLDRRLIIAGEDPEHIRESQLRLARVGVENVAGFLADGIVGWIRSGFRLDYIPQITVKGFIEMREQQRDHVALLDVREMEERQAGAMGGSLSIPLGKLESRARELNPAKLTVVYCKGGYRSSIATSILRRAGFRDVAYLVGGFDAWKAAGLPSAPISANGRLQDPQTYIS